MKRIFSLLLVLALLLIPLASCGTAPEQTTPGPADAGPSASAGASPGTASPASAPAEEPSAQELAELVFPYSGCQAPERVDRLNTDASADDLAFYLENAYGLAEGDWEDAAIIRATGASAFELAVLRCPGEEGALRVSDQLAAYIIDREGDFTGYAPAEADMAAKGSVNQQGEYAALFICPETGLAGAAFTAALDGTPMPNLPDSSASSPAPSAMPSEEPSPDPSEESSPDPSEEPSPEPSEEPSPDPSEEPSPASAYATVAEPSPAQYPGRADFNQPNIDDMSLYDTSAIRSAWKTGDPSGLSADDRAIYDAAQSVLGSLISDGMDDYAKEYYIYQWIVLNINYDWRHQDVMVPTPRESYTPYGGLVSHTAVCLGYATTFQLLMDLAGVECITVVGASQESTEDHGWNMVHLNGSWTCVDSTWDANWREQGATSGRPDEWRYFNMSSDYMAETNHQWDYNHVPEGLTLR